MFNLSRRQVLQYLGCSLMIGQSGVLKCDHSYSKDENCPICKGGLNPSILDELGGLQGEDLQISN
jgi:hypothetical protein